MDFATYTLRHHMFRNASTPGWCVVCDRLRKPAALSATHSVAYTLFEAPLAPFMLWNLLPVGLSYALLQVTLRFKDDGDLAKRLQDRDPRAMSDLYDRYGRLAYSLIYRVVRNTGAARFGTGDVFASVDRVRIRIGRAARCGLLRRDNRAIDYLRSVDGKNISRRPRAQPAWTPSRVFSNFDDNAFDAGSRAHPENGV